MELALENEAVRRGTTPQMLALKIIESQLPAASIEESAKVQTLYDFLKPHLDSLPEPPPDAPQTNYSQDTGRKFAEAMVEKHRQGRL
ncbi:MAG TPA: hypothetical protein VGI40_00390 [Pirellulaceae bacterium]